MSAPKVTPPPPETVDERCPQCREQTPHQVVKGRVVKGGLGVEGTFSCSVCGHVHQGIVRFAQPEHIPLIISKDAESIPAQVPVFADDEVRVGDEFEIEDELVEVTAIELKDERRRVKSARADAIHTLWGKNIDQIRVGFSLNEGETTRAIEVDFGPDDEISVGDVFDLEGSDVVVDKVITTDGKRNRGTFNVREIKRVWLKRPARRRDEPPKSARDSGPARAPRAGGRSSRGPPRGGGGRPGQGPRSRAPAARASAPDRERGDRPGYGSKHPSGAGDRPGYGSKRPSAGGDRPGYGAKRPSGAGGRPGYGSKRPSGAGGRPGYGSKRPSGAGDRPGYGSKRPSGGGGGRGGAGPSRRPSGGGGRRSSGPQRGPPRGRGGGSSGPPRGRGPAKGRRRGSDRK